MMVIRCRNIFLCAREKLFWKLEMSSMFWLYYYIYSSFNRAVGSYLSVLQALWNTLRPQEKNTLDVSHQAHSFLLYLRQAGGKTESKTFSFCSYFPIPDTVRSLWNSGKRDGVGSSNDNDGGQVRAGRLRQAGLRARPGTPAETPGQRPRIRIESLRLCRGRNCC